METKQVPWWRKALDFALSGFRTGFGLFSRTEKNPTEIKPEIVAGHQKFREEAELTDRSPAQDQIVEALEVAETASEPEVESVAAREAAVLEKVAALEVDRKAEAEAEAPVEQDAAPALDTTSEPEVVEPEPQPEPQPEIEAELQPPSEIEPADLSDTRPPEAEVEQRQAEAMLESDLESDTVEALEPEAEAQPISTIEPAEIADAPAIGAEVEQQKAEPVQKSEPELAVSEEPAPEAAIQDKPDGETFAATEDLTPEAAREPAAASEVEEAFPKDTDQLDVMTNELVDEVTMVAQSAISEDTEAEAPSPVPDEMAEHVAKLPDDLNELDKSNELPEEPPQISAEIESDADQSSEQVVELAPGPGGQAIVEESDAGKDGAVEPQMELNHPNPETAAEQVEESVAPGSAVEEPVAATVETAASEEPAAAPETASQEPQATDEPEAAEPQEAAVALANNVSAAQHPSKPFIKHELRAGEVDNSTFSVIVSQVYDGPLDLLLDLIRKQDIDIYDIPIARITAQFLAYVNQLKASDVDVAGEFIYTASLLIHIKSKMLLPRAPSGPEDAVEDPRRELVERLLEHERFKNAAQMLQQKQMLEAATWTNPGVRDFKEDTGAEPEIAADTVDLVRVFRDILERARNRPVINVEEDSVTVGQMIQFLSRRLSMEDKPIALKKLLSQSRSERALIAMFLALLELVRLQAILLRQDRAFSEIFIKKHSNFEEIMTQAPTHDDWN